MHKLLISVSLALLISACGDDDKAEDTAMKAVQSDTDSAVTSNITPQSDLGVAEKLQNAVSNVMDEAAEKSKELGAVVVEKSKEVVAETSTSNASDAQAVVSPATEEDAGVMEKLKEMGAAVSTGAGELLEDGKAIGSSAIEKTKAAGAVIAEKSEPLAASAIEKTKAAGQKLLEEGKEIGGVVVEKTGEVVESAKEKGSAAIEKGKAMMKDDEANPPVEAVKIDSIENGQDKPEAAADKTSEGMTKKALSELVMQMEQALGNLEKAAAEAKQAAAALHQEVGQ